MIVSFEKMHGLGNDFVFIDKSKLSRNAPIFEETTCGFLSNRKYGIGCDTIVFYEYNDKGEVEAVFVNSDGSIAEVCINASRCLGLLLSRKTKLSSFSMTSCGKTYKISVDNDVISVDVKNPSFVHKDLGIEDTDIDLFNLLPSLDLQWEKFHRACALSIGNPHLVLFLKEPIFRKEKEILGARLECHSFFKNRINVSFALIIERDEINLEVFERGVGLTLACGSGACASAFTAHKFGLVGDRVRVVQPGGSLDISINGNSMTQSGTAKYVFEGKIEI